MMGERNIINRVIVDIIIKIINISILFNESNARNLHLINHIHQKIKNIKIKLLLVSQVKIL